jgi:hypothetical protein
MVLVSDILDKKDDVLRSLGRDVAQKAFEAAEIIQKF